MKTVPRKRLYTTGEAALILGLAGTTVRRLISRGDLTCFRIPGQVNSHRRIPHEDLVRLAESNGIPMRFSEESINREAQ